MASFTSPNPNIGELVGLEVGMFGPSNSGVLEVGDLGRWGSGTPQGPAAASWEVREIRTSHLPDFAKLRSWEVAGIRTSKTPDVGGPGVGELRSPEHPKFRSLGSREVEKP